MDTFTLVFSISCGLLIVVAFAVTMWLFSRHKKLDREWAGIEKSIKRQHFNMARAIVMQHSDPEWRQEWLQKIGVAERSNQ